MAQPELLGCKTIGWGIYTVVVFRDPVGCRLTRQVWMRADIDSEALARVLLRKANIKIRDTVEETLKNQFNLTLQTSELYIMPSFNDFLGGRPINEYRSKEMGAEA